MKLSRTLVVILKAVVLLPVCSMYLWWAYSMRGQVSGGFRTFSQAVVLVIGMATITTVLTAIVWILSPRLHRELSWIGLALRTCGETAIILILYAALVFAWRETWSPARGMSESASFLPIVGHINAEFFAEAGWLEFLIVVVPFVSLFSGALTSSVDFLQEQRQLMQRNGIMT